MAASETPQLLESPSEIWAEIDKKLTEDGHSAECSEEEKLVFLWQMYQQTEDTLQTAIENEEKLKIAQTAEMQEVENYVEHIRHLSDEREALIQELETENDQLKQDIEQLKQDQNASALRDETAEMLIQQGLEEIASVSTSEQIAFLLVERARLLDELEAEQNRSAMFSPTGEVRESETELQKTLEKERTEFEEELAQQRESIKHIKEQLRQEHEEEINALMEENNKLEDDLVEAKGKMGEYEKEQQLMKEEQHQLREELQAIKDKTESGCYADHDDHENADSRASTPRLHGRPASPSRTSNDVALRNIIQEKTKLEGELLTLKSQLRNVTAENDDLQSKIDTLKKELEELKSLHQQRDMKNKSLKAELEETEQQLDEAENTAEDLARERNQLKDTLNSTESDLKTLRAELQTFDSLKEVVDILNTEKEQLSTELEALKNELDEACTEKEMLATQKLELSKGELDLASQLNTLKQELRDVNEENQIFTQQKEQLMQTLTLLDSTKSELENIKEEKHKLNTSTELLNKQNKELLNRLESTQQELSNLTQHNQEKAKQEIILSHVKEQNQKLSNELNVVASQLEEKKRVEIDLNQQLEELAHLNEEANERYNREVDDLKAKLKLTFNELGKSKTMLEDQYEQNSVLQDQLKEVEQMLSETSQTKTAYESKTEEVSELKQRLSEVEQCLTEKSTFEQMFAEKRDEIFELERELDELEGLKTELECTKDQLDKERVIRGKMEDTINELEQILEDQKREHDSIQQSQSAKLKTYENRMKALQDDLFSAQDELQTAQERHEKELQHAKAATMDLQERMEVEKQHTLQAEVNNASQRIEAQKVSNLERQIETMKIHLTETQNHLEQTIKDKSGVEHEVKVLKETVKQGNMDSKELENVRKDLMSAHRELEHLRLSTHYNEEERQRHVDRITSLEDLSKQLELDNREMDSKLSDSSTQIRNLEDQLQREKQRHSDKNYQSSKHVMQIEKDLESSTQQCRQLREDLQKKQTYVMKLEADAIGNAAKYESTIARLESEVSDVKQYHKKELDSTQGRLSSSNQELQNLREQLRDKEQEVSKALQDASRVKGASDRLEAQLQTEIKIRTDMENRNTSLDQEVSKMSTSSNVWTQVRSLMDKNASLEAAKRTLEDELDRKKSSSRQSESTFAQSSASQEAALKTSHNRADAAEKRAEKLQMDLNDMSFKMRNLEHQLTHGDYTRNTLMEKKEHIASIRNQLETEKLQRTLLDQTVSELKHQVSLLKQRETKVVEQNRELQHTILDLEAKLEDMQDRSQTAMEMHQHLTEVGKRSLMDQIIRMQKETKDLQYELLTVNERREIQERKYEERKVKTKHKLMRAREFYAKERSRMQDQMGRIENDLRLTRSSLRKELDWKEKMDKNYQHILHEKRDLLTQLSDQEEVLHEKGRSVSTLQVRAKFLEEENSRLLDRVEMLTQRKNGLDKALKVNKDRELTHGNLSCDSRPHSLTGGTSGLGNSMDSSWTNDHDHYADHNMIPFRNQSSTHIDNYLSRNYSGHVVDLYRAETGSEESFSHEFDA